MAEEHDVRPGLDRRSLIKKGLVGAGIAVTAPVISTFNAAAFAVSIPGCHTIQYKITPSSGAIVVDPMVVGCLPTGWEPPDGTINPFITASAQAGNVWRFVLSPDAEGCTFTDASASKNDQTCSNYPGAGWVLSGGGTQLDFDRDELSNDNAEFHVKLVICCDPP